MKLFALCGALIALALAAPSAQAQAPPLAAPVEPADHDARVDELARVLGRAHYLRVLCQGPDDQTWRDAMQSLLSVEAPRESAGRRRGDMVDLFNNGWRYEEERFPDCSEEAREANRALSAQGRRLADGLAAPYRSE